MLRGPDAFGASGQAGATRPVQSDRREEETTMRRMLTSLLLAAFASTWLAACASLPRETVTTPRTYEGAGIGGAVGAGAGALIDKNNRWRGALIGGALGAVLGGTLTEIRSRAAREAAAENRPVAYQSEDGFQRVEAAPYGAPSSRGCRQVQERVYQNGQLVQDTLREVCA